MKAYFLILSLGTLVSCASMEPEPCTAAWVDWKRDQILDDFTDEHRSAIRSIRRISDDLRDPTMLSPMRIASAADEIRAMADTFANRTLPEVRSALSQCSTTTNGAKLLADLLRREGVDEETLAWVEALGALQFGEDAR